MTPAAHIPMHTPDEAIAELEHAVGELGFKAIMINGLIHRPIGAGTDAAEHDPKLPNWGSGSGERLDCLGLDSAFDYDPFWRRCVELRVVPGLPHPRAWDGAAAARCRTTCRTTSARSQRAWKPSVAPSSWAA